MENTTEAILNYDIPKLLFSWFDYTIFTGMLAISVLIGLYFGIYGKQDTTEDYLLGGKTMKHVPVAISVIASHISGITLLAVPADVYTFGANYCWVCLCTIFVCLITVYVYLPVFCKLQETSMFEYLNLRFDKGIRTLVSFLFTLSTFIYNPVVVYIPSLAFSQATGIDLHIIVPVMCIICIFYTTIGGLKAVIWTDTFQFFGIVGSTITIFFLGASSVGGFSVVWEKALKGQRLDVLEVDPTIRDGFWPILVGGTIYWINSVGLNQGVVQKLLAVPTFQHAKKALMIYCIGITSLIGISVFTGVIIYAKYSDCDPLTAKQINRSDQMLPYFVMDVAGHVPGLPGIFTAGIFCAALSTLSATLNTIACTIYSDFISPFMPIGTTEKLASNILKLIVVISGTICIALVFVIEQMGGMLQFNITIQGIINGPLLGIFTLGLLFPMANTKGALYGGLCGLVFISWIAIGNQFYGTRGLIKSFAKPISTQGCYGYFNITTIKEHVPLEEPFVLYRISFWYFSAMGAIVVIVVGLIVSWFTRNNDKPVHPDLISPIVYVFFPKCKQPTPTPSYLSVDKALYLVTQNNNK